MTCSVLITTRLEHAISSTVAQFPTYEQAEYACEEMDEQKNLLEATMRVSYLRLYKVAKGD